MKIISTVPSITELLYDLELKDDVIAITKFCIHPKLWYQNKERIGGTKTLNVQRIIELKPDWVIANKEENEKAQIEEISKHCQVFITDIKTIEDNITLIKELSTLFNVNAIAQKLITRFHALKIDFHNKTIVNAVYLIWKDPYMSVGCDTFIHDIMNLCGFNNMLNDNQRYPTLTNDDLILLAPEYVLLSSEPYPFKEKHISELQVILPNSKIMLVDGEAFSWYGSRLLKKHEYLKNLSQSK